MKDLQIKELRKYKKFAVPAILNLLTFFLIFWVIIPQIGQIPEILSKITTQQNQIKTLNKSLTILKSASDADVDTNFETSVAALPTAKDVASIFEALSSAASVSNTQVQNFSFDVGGIFGRAAGLSDSTVGAPSIEVSASITGPDSNALTQFGSELTKRLPLAEIKNLSMNNNSATYQIGFFYKPLDTNKLDNRDNVKPLTQDELNLLNQLKEWKQ